MLLTNKTTTKRAVISTAHNLFLDRPNIQLKLPPSWSKFIVFLKEAGYSGGVACALVLQVHKRQLKVTFVLVCFLAICWFDIALVVFFQHTNNMIQLGTKGDYVLASPGRQRDLVARAKVQVGQKVMVCFNNRIYAGVIEQKGAVGRVVVKYTGFKGNFQEYTGGDWRKYLV